MLWWRKAVLGFGAACLIGFPALAGQSRKPVDPNVPPPPQPGTFEAVIANNPISAILQGPRLWTTPEEPLDWVKASRGKKDPEFMPVGVTPPSHSLKVKSADELDAAKADLEKAQAALQAQLANKPALAPIDSPPAAVTKAADKPKPKKLSKAKPKVPAATAD